MTERNWDAVQVAAELEAIAVAAQQVSIFLSRIFLKAAPEVALKLDKLDKTRHLDIDEALEDFSKTAHWISEQLLDELEYPTGGSHRPPGYRHGDAA